MSSPESAVSDVVRLLMIDDDQKLCRMVNDYLGPLGFEITAVHDGPSGLERVLSETWDVVLLDVMLPGMDGFEVLKRIRAKCEVPVLMLTARGDEMDRIVGLEEGADKVLDLTAVEFDLLRGLARAKGRVKSREALLDEVRERNYDVFDRSIDVHISALRKKLGDDARNPRFIRTLRSVGYLFIDPASRE